MFENHPKGLLESWVSNNGGRAFRSTAPYLGGVIGYTLARYLTDDPFAAMVLAGAGVVIGVVVDDWLGN